MNESRQIPRQGRRSKDIPPWGQMLQPHMGEILSPIIAVDFRREVTEPRERHRRWQEWIEDTLDVLGDNVWPRWSLKGGWVGRARDHMVELTYDDFEVMGCLLDSLDEPVAVGDPAQGFPHSGPFILEDTKGFGPSFRNYDESLGKTIDALTGNQQDLHIGQWTGRLIRDKCGSSTLELKFSLQRPRAYQIALAWRIPGFRHRAAVSANTPSMISGHSYNALTGGMALNALIARSRRHGTNDQAVEMLQQYAIDVGDRRVFAGVHYPSDNIASWLVSFRVADNCFEDPSGARAFIAGAIRKSAVANAIAEYSNARGTSALAAAWSLVAKEVERDLSEMPGRASSRPGPAAPRA